MSSRGERSFSFEGFTLDLTRGCLRGEDGEIQLRPKSFDLLCLLVQNGGRLVSKGDLMKAVWPDVFVTEDSLTRCVSELRRALRDTDQRIIKTVQRRGYLFASPVSPLETTFTPSVERSAEPSSVRASRLSVVVLPFTNLSGSDEQEYFVDGITDNLTTDLSRIPGAFVIARNTAFTFRGRAVDARQIGRELGVRNLVEGSVQRSRNRVRINAQLIDTISGAHLWAERFDKRMADLFDMQDEITARLARTFGIELVAAESRRAERERPNSMDSVDLCMRGRMILNQSPSLDHARAARRFFEAALGIDLRSVDALTGLALTHLHEVNNYASEDPMAQLRLAEDAISRALSLAPDSAEAHFGLAKVLYATHAPDRALRECELAVNLDRNFAAAYAYAGAMKIFMGCAEDTKASVVQAIRLSPRDPALGTWHLYIGGADLFLGRVDHAIGDLRKSVELNPNYELAYFYLAAALALAGRGAEAADARAAGQRLLPSFNIAKFRADARSTNGAYLAQRERILEGLRLTGVPER